MSPLYSVQGCGTRNVSFTVIFQCHIIPHVCSAITWKRSDFLKLTPKYLIKK